MEWLILQTVIRSQSGAVTDSFVRTDAVLIKCNISNGKCFDKFMVERIKIVNKNIVGLSIINLSLKTDNPRERRCFVWKKEASDNG